MNDKILDKMNDKITESYKKLQFYKEIGNKGMAHRMVNYTFNRIEKMEARKLFLEEQKYRQL